MKRKVSVKLLPFAIETGKPATPMIVKSPAFVPATARETKFNVQLPVLPIVNVWTTVDGEVRSSVATPPKSSALEPSVTFGEPADPVIGKDCEGFPVSSRPSQSSTP